MIAFKSSVLDARDVGALAATCRSISVSLTGDDFARGQHMLLAGVKTSARLGNWRALRRLLHQELRGEGEDKMVARFAEELRAISNARASGQDAVDAVLAKQAASQLITVDDINELYFLCYEINDYVPPIWGYLVEGDPDQRWIANTVSRIRDALCTDDLVRDAIIGTQGTYTTFTAHLALQAGSNRLDPFLVVREWEDSQSTESDEDPATASTATQSDSAFDWGF